MGIIQNEKLRVTYLANDIGFLISSIYDLEHEKEWIFAQEKIIDKRDLSKSFDEQYAGGMECIFPSDEEERFRDDSYPDHGVLWRVPYQVEQKEDCLTAKSCEAKSGILIMYQMKLVERELNIQLTLSNQSKKEVPYLARLHPAFLAQVDTALSLNIEDILFEPCALYCSFQPKRIDKQNDLICTTEEKKILCERPDTWAREELFFHIRQTKGEFEVKKKERKICFRYDNKKMPYLTLCSFQKDGRRIVILEPANVPGVSLRSVSNIQEVPVLYPNQSVTYDFRILPE